MQLPNGRVSKWPAANGAKAYLPYVISGEYSKKLMNNYIIKNNYLIKFIFHRRY